MVPCIEMVRVRGVGGLKAVRMAEVQVVSDSYQWRAQGWK